MGRLLSIIGQELALPNQLLMRLIMRAPYTYKVYTIPKRSGGERTIAQPAKETKYIQQWLIYNLFNNLPVHDCAMAYRDGRGIKDNAKAHQINSYLTKMDFKDFFPSIKQSDLVAHFGRHLSEYADPEDLDVIARICCIKTPGSDKKHLSVGAPTSPILSNSIMHEFDSNIDAWCKECGITYTRYADDLAFSTNVKGRAEEIESVVQKIVSELQYPKLRFNRKKTVHISKKYQRKVTGVIINNDGNISLGRKRKRFISSLVHKFVLNALDESGVRELQGLLAFALDVEPAFIARMKVKYGDQVVEGVIKRRFDKE